MNVLIVAALSADGFIAPEPGRSSLTWTTTADKKFFVRKTKEVGVVIMGRKTFETFGKPLKDRRLIIMTSQPSEIAIEGVEATNEQPNELLKRLGAEGVANVVVGGGTHVYSEFMQAGLVNELFLTIMPKLFGTGVSLFADHIDYNLELVEQTTLDDGQSVLLHYSVAA